MGHGIDQALDHLDQHDRSNGLPFDPCQSEPGQENGSSPKLDRSKTVLKNYKQIEGSK